jgi:hypothetical protein
VHTNLFRVEARREQMELLRFRFATSSRRLCGIARTLSCWAKFVPARLLIFFSF